MIVRNERHGPEQISETVSTEDGWIDPVKIFDARQPDVSNNTNLVFYSRFENIWLRHKDFIPVVQAAWNQPTHHVDPAKRLMAKFTKTRKALKDWHRSLPSLATTIEHMKLTIQFLDFIEETRDLTVPEWNFKDLVLQQVQDLLNLQKTYWKQRSAIKWARCGDANTKFFHANATIKHRCNTIASIEDNNGNQVHDHNGKSTVLFEAYKDRLGTTKFSKITFHLPTLLHSSVDLRDLEAPLSVERINSIISTLPSGKSPGPNGFNTDFMKKCWPVIAPDFYALCQGFFDGSICMQSINGSHVVLIPKKDSPITVSDYRPISLLNSSVKLLTKILANRLQKVITKLIHRNQYGFIRGRTIQDCLAWTFEYIHLCKKSKKEMVILKLDFEKAFDKIEHQAIMEVLKHKGFGPKWMLWMDIIMNSRTSAILLNGLPGKTFHCRRGVRQGDPLLSLLFVLAADVQQSIVNKAKDLGLLKLPLQYEGSHDFPIIQYADDTILVMEACPRQLFFLKAMLNSFADSTGLKVNYHKSNIYPH